MTCRCRYAKGNFHRCWGQVAAAALTQGILKGAGLSGIGDNGFASDLAQGAVNSAVSQGVNITLGLQKSFSWKEIAVSSVSTAV